MTESEPLKPCSGRVGLMPGTVALQPYQPSWKAAFEKERVELLSFLRDEEVEVQHVGSTAIPGMIAKPIIDIAIGLIAAERIGKIVERLVSAGYADRGHFGRDGGVRLVVKEDAEGRRIIHLHILPKSDRKWGQYKTFKETLSANANLHRQYAELKVRLASAHSTDRRKYTSGKAEFLDRVHAGAVIDC